MSTWRDIWRYGVIANRFYSENEEQGEEAFNKLKEVYDAPQKDGMIRYIMAEAYELKYRNTKNSEYKDRALANYDEAKELFPVDHWKEVASKSYERLSKDMTAEEYFGYKYKETVDRKGKKEYLIEPDFKGLLQYAFQKVYTFTHLNDFARYVCLSALSRGDSEWPLSLVDFRTVLELEIKQCFPKVIGINDDKKYNLKKTIDKLKFEKNIDIKTIKAFDNIRIAGNIAAHQLYGSDSFKKQNVVNFVKTLEFFNNYRAKEEISLTAKPVYPLCQLTIEQFRLIPDEEKIKKAVQL